MLFSPIKGSEQSLCDGMGHLARFLANRLILQLNYRPHHVVFLSIPYELLKRHFSRKSVVWTKEQVELHLHTILWDMCNWIIIIKKKLEVLLNVVSFIFGVGLIMALMAFFFPEFMRTFVFWADLLSFMKKRGYLVSQELWQHFGNLGLQWLAHFIVSLPY